MIDISNYLKARKIAVAIAVIILVLGSIIYFSTNVAKRNNEMMYKEIYGENTTIKSDVDDAGLIVDKQNVRTALV